jgi:N-formylglutamate deformylase
MKKLILHIPHSSTSIPLKDGYLVNDDVLQNEMLKLIDWHTEDLFDSDTSEKIEFGHSRIFCDPERFADDALEPMAKLGMGVLYEKTDENQPMRLVTPALREKILTAYYYPHHAALTQAVANQLKCNKKAIVLDCHSYPDKPLNRNSNQTRPLPDFNIGTDSYHTPEKLIDISVRFFEERGLSMEVDYPFSGALVPMEYYQKNKQVMGIMLEVNRKLYLKPDSSEKSENYHECKKIVQDYMELLEREL